MTGTALRRVLYVPNEEGEALQSGYRRAFADLVDAGLLDEVEVFSLERRITAGGDPAAHRADLLAAARRFRPDLLFMQHLGRTGLAAPDLARLTADGTPLLYQEADPYTRWLHPLPASSRVAARFADVAFTVGSGVFAGNLRRAGAKRVAWTPSAFDPARIDREVGGPDRDVDVVMIANRSVARFRQLPSAGRRVRFVREAEQRLGDRFALYGRDWAGPSARGTVAYSNQTRVLRSAWMSATWDHFAGEPRYFSDRLAIALASGSVFATTRHPGYDDVFPADAPYLVTGRTPAELVSRMEDWFRRTSPAQRLEAEEAARRFAWSHLRQDDNLVLMLNAVGAGIDTGSAAAAWNLGRPALQGG